MFNKKLNRLLAIMLASVMGATSLPATQVSADTPSSEYDISNDAASDDISDSKIPDEQDSDNNATEEKQPQQLTVEYTPADDIYVGNKVVPVVKSDRADAAVDNLKYTVVEGKNLIEKDTDFASNGIWTAKDTGTVRIKVTKAEDDKYKSAEAEYTVTIKEYDYSSMNNSLTGTMLQGTQFYVEAPTLSLASDNQAVYVVRKGDEWIEADKYQLMPQQGDNRQTLVIARKDKESGAITDIGSLRLDYKYDTQPPKITLNPKEDDKPAFTKDAVDYYGNVRKVDMNIHDVSLDDGSTQLWVKVDDREEFDVFDVDNAQKLIDAGIEYSEWIVTGADYSSCITFGTKADEEHKYQIIGMYAKDQAEHECNDTSSIEQPFYVDRKAPSGTIGYDADLIDEQNMVSQQASNVYGQLEDISGITVNIIDAGGKQVTETAGQGGKLLDFSINKGGSIFSLDDNTMKLVKDYYVQKVYHDVVVREINPDEVTSCTVKVNGKALKQGTDFSVNNVSESDGWHKYEYVISNAVFEKEGQYNIVVETKDKADSVAYSDVKSVNIEFIVDKTAPTYTLTGVDKNNENYIGSKNAVLMPKDDGGKLGRVKITVVGKDDKEKKVIKEMSGDDMLDYLDKHDGKIEFEVPKEVLSAKDGDSRLMVECADCSVDEGGKTNEVKKIYGKDTEADTEIAEDDVPMESNSSDVKSVETNNDKAVYIIGAILLFVLIIAILIIVYYMRKKMKEKKDNDEQ